MESNRLTSASTFSLFIVSYIPLIFIMSFHQFYVYREYLAWGGLTNESLLCFIHYFGAVTFLIILSIIGISGLNILLKNVKRRVQTSGDVVRITDIENKNNESITYLFTYVIPFIFQDLSEISNVVAVFTLLVVTYFIYINSSLILINPTISMKYSLYMVEYSEETQQDNKVKRGMILSNNKHLEELQEVKLKKIGYKLFYAETFEGNNG